MNNNRNQNQNEQITKTKTKTKMINKCFRSGIDFQCSILFLKVENRSLNAKKCFSSSE